MGYEILTVFVIIYINGNTICLSISFSGARNGTKLHFRINQIFAL